jgi:hypothetical protein
MGHDDDRKHNKTESPDSWDIFQGIFNRSNIIWLLWLLAIFLVVYFCVSLFSANSELKPLRISRLLDIMIFGILFIYILVISLNPPSDSSQTVNTQYHNFIDFMKDPYSIFGVIFFILALYLTIYIVGIPMSPDIKPFSISFIENVAWLLFLILLIFDFFNIVLNIDLADLFPSKLNDTSENKRDSSTKKNTSNVTNIYNYFNTSDTSGNKVKKDSSGNKQDSSGNKQTKPNQVFNISNNLYSYDEAQDICQAFDSTLATYEQVESAYNDGAEWCAYGWSDNQMAFFPTQQSTWNKLQKNEKTKNACGRPGVNGGYMANPNIRFGVNCYGQKPDPTQYELDLMNSNLPTNIVDSHLDEKVKFWKENREKLLVLNSFNHNKWSEY